MLFWISNNFIDINPNNPNPSAWANPNDPLSQEEKALVEQTFNALKNIISLSANSAQ